MPTYNESKDENKTYSPIEVADSIIPTDGLTIDQPKGQAVTDTHSSGVIPDRDIFLFDKDSKVMRTDKPEQTITGTFNFGEWLKIDASNKRLVINDGVVDRVLVGDYGSSIYGVKISKETFDVKTAADADLIFNTQNINEGSTEDGTFHTTDGKVIVVTNGIITDIQMESPSLSPSQSPSISPSVSISKSPSLSVSKSPSVSPSVSISLSPSVSVSLSPSASVSPSVSVSLSPSETPSPSVSISLSPSLSPSVSESLSPSVSISLSPSLSPSPSSSISFSPSESLAPPVIVDSYSESNYFASTAGLYSTYPGKGQSFTGDGGTLNSAKFYAMKANSPTGSIYAKIYSHSGSFGTTSIPDTLLATSDAYDVSTLPTSLGLVTFNFTGAEKITLTNTTKFVATIEYTGGDSTNRALTGIDTSSPTHAGNFSDKTAGTWSANSGFDLIFYVYKDGS